jgi:hypothetical protein
MFHDSSHRHLCFQFGGKMLKVVSYFFDLFVEKSISKSAFHFNLLRQGIFNNNFTVVICTLVQ